MFLQFRFATKMDIFLMIIGTIGSLGNAATLPLMLIVFMNIFDSITDFGKKFYFSLRVDSYVFFNFGFLRKILQVFFLYKISHL